MSNRRGFMRMYDTPTSLRRLGLLANQIPDRAYRFDLAPTYQTAKPVDGEVLRPEATGGFQILLGFTYHLVP